MHLAMFFDLLTTINLSIQLDNAARGTKTHEHYQEN